MDVSRLPKLHSNSKSLPVPDSVVFAKETSNGEKPSKGSALNDAEGAMGVEFSAPGVPPIPALGPQLEGSSLLRKTQSLNYYYVFPKGHRPS